MSLHSREASCSRQSPSTLERKADKDTERSQEGSGTLLLNASPAQ